MRITDINQLTPVEEHNGILYKRDDLYIPFDDIPLSGNKLRQSIKLIEKLKLDIKQNYNNKIATTCNIKSPQGLIVARVAKEYGISCMVGYSNTKPVNDVIAENIILKNIINVGAEVRIIAKMGLETNMQSKLKEICKKDNFFIIKFGINAELHKDCILETAIRQVENIPDVDNIVITVGSGLTAAGILKGLVEHKKKIKNIYCVQPFGYDRMKTIESIFPGVRSRFKNFNFVVDKLPYNKEIYCNIDDFDLDNIYEAKVHRWMMKQNLKGTTLFYIIGNANAIRNNIF